MLFIYFVTKYKLINQAIMYIQDKIWKKIACNYASLPDHLFVVQK